MKRYLLIILKYIYILYSCVCVDDNKKNLFIILIYVYLLYINAFTYYKYAVFIYILKSLH